MKNRIRNIKGTRKIIKVVTKMGKRKNNDGEEDNKISKKILIATNRIRKQKEDVQKNKNNYVLKEKYSEEDDD